MINAIAGLRNIRRPHARIPTEPLARFPVFAATPASDPQWSAIVVWSTYALQRAELPATPWTAAGLDLVIEGCDRGLAEDWGKHVVGAAGSYPDIYARISATARLSNFRAGQTRRPKSAACSSRPFANRRGVVASPHGEG